MLSRKSTVYEDKKQVIKQDITSFGNAAFRLALSL